MIDGIDTGYDLMKMPDGYVVGMIISEDTKHVEIIGTNVIPEFGSYSVMILGASIFGFVYLARSSWFAKKWTRIKWINSELFSDFLVYIPQKNHKVAII